ILNLEATDSHTIVITLREPTASILAALSSQLQGQFFILPKEADTGFNPERDPHGAGAYYLEEYLPSARLAYARNPNSYAKRSYPDRFETPIITENAQVVAQLIAGNIHTHYTRFPPDQVLDIKGDQPLIALYQTPIAQVGVTTFFG